MSAFPPARMPGDATSSGAGETVPRSSVIIVNHNGRKHLERCLPSLLREDCRNCQIILVDNASTDGSARYVEHFFPQVLVIRNHANLGFGHGSNLGAQCATGEYLVFLNPDTIVEPGWLDTLLAVLEADTQVGLATSKILLLADPERINTCGNVVHYTGVTLCRGAGFHKSAFQETGEVDAVSGAAFAIKRKVFEELGGFDERFFLYMEDTDLSWRARLAGYKCLYVPQSIVYHDYTLRFGPAKTFYQERNRYLMLLKSLRWPTLIVLLPALMLAELVTWGFVFLRERKRLANKLRAYVWIFTHWGQVMQSRRQVQALRRVRDRDLLIRCTHRLAFEQVDSGPISRLAHLVFDPLFFVFHRLALALIWW
jgi:GT2 family glycosyltransferase